MPTFRERLADFFLGDQKRALQSMTKQLYEAYLAGPYQMPPGELIRQLSEYDSSYVWDLVTQLNYDRLGYSYGLTSSDAERQRAIQESRRLFKYDVITQWVIWLWTNFVFSENVSVYPNDETGTEVWDEFWDASRNHSILAPDNIQALSEDLLKDGNVFFAHYISTLDGKDTLRVFNPDEIVEIITDPGDKMVPIFYKRVYSDGAAEGKTLYYPDWEILNDASLPERLGNSAPKNEERANVLSGEKKTSVVIHHAAHNVKDRWELFGYPLINAGTPWIREHKRFRENRATVAATVAMYVNKLKIKGGTRAMDVIKARLNSTMSMSSASETNPPAAPGSTWLENEAADLTRLPLNTGAGDAKSDGEALLLMAGLGGGIYPHWLGSGDAYRLATATSMEAPMLRQFSRYQMFWSSQFKTMLRIVLTAANKYGKSNIDDMTGEVSIDRLIKTDLQNVATSISNMYQYGLQPYLDSGIITAETAKPILASTWRVVLQALDIEEADELTSDEAFGIETEDEGGQSVTLSMEIERINQVLREILDKDTGKFKPSKKGTLKSPTASDTEITAEDVQAAIKNWDKTMPPELRGMLNATETEVS